MQGPSGGDVPDPGWDRFRVELTAQLEGIADVDAVIVEVLEPAEPTALQAETSWLSRKLRPKQKQGSPPYIQFAAVDETWLHMEASSNTFLAPPYQLDQAAAATLGMLGWSPPTGGRSGGFASPNYSIDRPLADAPEMAVLAVQTFIEVFGVTDVAALRTARV
jgi:hypothetical protein